MAGHLPEDGRSAREFCQASRSACYNQERDGPLDVFLDTRNSGGTFALFDGLDAYELLKREGWLAPRISIIRLMWNAGRGDAHFQVTEDFRLEGIANAAHGGEPGIHEPADVFKDAPPFEAHALYGPAFDRWQEKAMAAAEDHFRNMRVPESGGEDARH